MEYTAGSLSASHRLPSLAMVPVIGWCDCLLRICWGVPSCQDWSELFRSVRKWTVESYVSSNLLVAFANAVVDAVCWLSMVTQHLQLDRKVRRWY